MQFGWSEIIFPKNILSINSFYQSAVRMKIWERQWTNFHVKCQIWRHASSPCFKAVGASPKLYSIAHISMCKRDYWGHEIGPSILVNNNASGGSGNTVHLCDVIHSQLVWCTVDIANPFTMNVITGLTCSDFHVDIVVSCMIDSSKFHTKTMTFIHLYHHSKCHEPILVNQLTQRKVCLMWLICKMTHIMNKTHNIHGFPTILHVKCTTVTFSPDNRKLWIHWYSIKFMS